MHGLEHDPFTVALRGRREGCQVLAAILSRSGALLARHLADDAAGNLSKLGQVVAQILRLLLGVLDEFLEQLHENRRPHDDFSLMLDAVGVEIILGAGNAPAAPIALGGTTMPG